MLFVLCKLDELTQLFRYQKWDFGGSVSFIAGGTSKVI